MPHASTRGSHQLRRRSQETRSLAAPELARFLLFLIPVQSGPRHGLSQATSEVPGSALSRSKVIQAVPPVRQDVARPTQASQAATPWQIEAIRICHSAHGSFAGHRWLCCCAYRSGPYKATQRATEGQQQRRRWREARPCPWQPRPTPESASLSEHLPRPAHLGCVPAPPRRAVLWLILQRRERKRGHNTV